MSCTMITKKMLTQEVNGEESKIDSSAIGNVRVAPADCMKGIGDRIRPAGSWGVLDCHGPIRRVGCSGA